MTAVDDLIMMINERAEALKRESARFGGDHGLHMSV